MSVPMRQGKKNDEELEGEGRDARTDGRAGQHQHFRYQDFLSASFMRRPSPEADEGKGKTSGLPARFGNTVPECLERHFQRSADDVMFRRAGKLPETSPAWIINAKGEERKSFRFRPSLRQNVSFRKESVIPECFTCYFPAFAFITMSLKSVKKVRLSVGPAAASG